VPLIPALDQSDWQFPARTLPIVALCRPLPSPATPRADTFDFVFRYFAVDADFWSEFEERLASFDTDTLIDDASQFLVSYGADDWSEGQRSLGAEKRKSCLKESYRVRVRQK